MFSFRADEAYTVCIVSIWGDDPPSPMPANAQPGLKA